MKNNSFKNFYLVNDNKKRNSFAHNEIFANSYQILKQTKYSNNLLYFFLKQQHLNFFYTQLKNRCLISGYGRAVNSKLKLSRIALSRRILSGSVTGFYKSVW